MGMKQSIGCTVLFQPDNNTVTDTELQYLVSFFLAKNRIRL